MHGIVIRWLVTTVAILAVSYVMTSIKVEGFGTALVAGAILGILNALVRPVLIILTLPLTVVSLGFFILVINALLFQLAGAIVPGLHIASFWSALIGSVLVSIVSWIMNSLVAGGGGERTVIIRHTSGDRTVDLHRTRGGKWE